MCSLSPFSNSLPSLSIPGSSPQMLGHHSSTSHSIKWSTPLTHIKVIPMGESDSVPPVEAKTDISQCFFQQNDTTSTSGGDTSGASIKPLQVAQQSIPHTSSSLYSQSAHTSQTVSQSYPQTAISNPNLRFIAAHYQTKAKAQPNIHNKRSVGTTTVPKTVSEVVQDTPITTLELIKSLDIPSATTLTSDANDLFTGTGDEKSGPQQLENTRNQESSTEKQRNITAAKRHVIDIESDDPRNLKRRQGSNSHASSNIERQSDTAVLDGPRSIVHAFNNQATIHAKPAPRQARESQPTSTTTGVSHAAVRVHQKSAGSSNTMATSSKVRVEDMGDMSEDMDDDMDENDDDDDSMELEMETGDPQRAHVRAGMVTTKVRRWADKLKAIRRASVDSLFETKIARVPAHEVLALLKDIDEHKDFTTRAEVEGALLEQLLDALVRREDGLGPNAKVLAVKILDNFGQRFHGVRYPPDRR